MPVVMKLVEWADGTPMKAIAGLYVRTVDVQKAGLDVEWLTLTPHIEKAKRWDNFGEAFTTWREVPEHNPTRLDGEVRRPFTAITVSIEVVPDGE